MQTPRDLGGLFATASRLAYVDDEAELVAGLKTIGMILLKRFPAAAPRNYVALLQTPQPYLCVLYRGTTANWNDIWADMDAREIVPGAGDWCGIGVDEGFFRRQDGSWSELRSFLPKRDPIIFGGHSLGAGEATVGTIRARARGFNVAGLLTYGSPRVGAPGLAGELQGIALRRYVHCCDIVTRVPAPPFYRHICPPDYLDRTGALIEHASRARMEWDRLCARLDAACAVVDAPADLSRWEALGLAHHRIAGYEAALTHVRPES